MDSQEVTPKDNDTYLGKVRQKATSTVQGLREETVGVLKDFSTREALIENSKKMHHLRVFAMVFMIFTLLLTTVSMVFTILNGFSSGHDIADLHFSASFNAGSIAFAIIAILLSFIYLRQAYRDKKLAWIPALLIPASTLFFLSYVSKSLSWYGMGADVAKGCANFAAILSLPPLFLELTVTGHMQKFGNLIKKFFVVLQKNNIHILRIISIAIGFTVLLIKIIELVYVGLSDQLYAETQAMIMGTFGFVLLTEGIYLLLTWKHNAFAWICPIVFTITGFIPTLIALIKEYPLAEELNYTAVTLSAFTIIFEFIARYVVKKEMAVTNAQPTLDESQTA